MCLASRRLLTSFTSCSLLRRAETVVGANLSGNREWDPRMPQELLFELKDARVTPHIATFGGTPRIRSRTSEAFTSGDGFVARRMPPHRLPPPPLTDVPFWLKGTATALSSRKSCNRACRLAGSSRAEEGVMPPSGDHPVGRDAERSELKRAFCSSLS